MIVLFHDRKDAGRRLAGRLRSYADREALVLGLPRGGVIVAAEIARELHCQLDVLVVRKLGAPGRPELAIGAVTDGDRPQRILNDSVLLALGVSREYLDAEIERQLAEVSRRQATYRGGRAPIPWSGRPVIIVDDGIATGSTVRAAVQALRQGEAGSIVLAVPVAPPETIGELRSQVDDLVCLETPTPFVAVGEFYEDFSQTTDDEVVGAISHG